MKNTLIVCLTLVTVGLISCGSNPIKKPKGSLKEVFVTQINTSGSKIFNYNLVKTMPNQNHKNNGKGQGMGKGQGGRKHNAMKSNRNINTGGTKNKIQKNAYKRLNIKLFETGFCREGYVELDHFIERGHVTIKGKCNESATKHDRELFINTD